ncbi:RICIN domain-containing protein [Streptomyces sp. BB1-1-1]|uniref:RICIN domain-containing protein n=1 Tax=Streptomyces sp. BB1-1-1 TaxID=3074430 RepID=UPI002877DF1E|nr:RICIN domain-containing protein [Streptomyces sp. BB1-1-1]WND37184.1 RICIN domain-containing protein [Streptomyces sp. BB1-1-1]
MARGDGTDGGAQAGDETYAGASDARLTELLRADTPTAYPALQELRARHQPAVLAYARLCTAGESTARQLAARTFALAARRAARGTDAGGPWRHQLLLLAGETAAEWAADERSAGLDAGLLLVVNTAGTGCPVPPMLAAFRSLPPRAQGMIWYGVVDREPADRTAELLGLGRQDVTYGTQPALQALAQACLRSRLAASEDPRCVDFRRLIEESVRPDTPRDSADLHAHMAHCPHCTAAHEELCTLRDTPRTALAEGLLPWAGTAYAARETDEPDGVTSLAMPGTWPPSRRFALASAALGVALVPLLFLVLSPDDTPSRPAANASTRPPAGPPPVTVTATVPATPSSPTPSPSPSASSKSPSPRPSPTPSRTVRPSPTPSTPSYRAPGGTYSQVVNVASDRCLDIDGGLEKGTDVVTAPCTSSHTQLWRVDAGRGVVQSYADEDYCLDSRGSMDEGVGIWECDSVDGRNGQNLRFSVNTRGVIRPGIAPDRAVTPGGGDAVVLVGTASGRTDQRWRAGAAS